MSTEDNEDTTRFSSSDEADSGTDDYINRVDGAERDSDQLTDSEIEADGDNDDSDLVSIIDKTYERSKPQNKFLRIAAKPVDVVSGTFHSVGYLIMYLGFGFAILSIVGLGAMTVFAIGSALMGILLGEISPRFWEPRDVSVAAAAEWISGMTPGNLASLVWDMLLFLLIVSVVFAACIACNEILMRFADQIKEGTVLGSIGGSAMYLSVGAAMGYAGLYLTATYSADDPLATPVAYLLYAFAVVALLFTVVTLTGVYKTRVKKV